MNNIFKRMTAVSAAVLMTVTAAVSCPLFSINTFAEPDEPPCLIEEEPYFDTDYEPSESGFIDPGYRFGISEGTRDDGDDASYAQEEAGGSGSALMRGGQPSAYSLIDVVSLFPELVDHDFVIDGEIPVTSVKNQGSNGLCWVFAPVAAAESSLLKAGQAEDAASLDISELQAAYYSQFRSSESSPSGCEGDTVALANPSSFGAVGGNDFFFLSGTARWCGLTDEETVPYSQLTTGLSPSLTDGTYASSVNRWLLRNADVLTGADREDIKALIKERGAVSGWVYYNSSYYRSDTCALYCPSSSITTNHEGAVVGWDDRYPRENFRSDRGLPSEDGAWLVKNSWGTGINRQGYYWLSYEDGPFMTGNVFSYDFEPVDHVSDHNYQHDGGIQNGYLSLKEQPDGIYMASVFRAESAELIKAVSFYCKEPGLHYDVSVYTSLAAAQSSASANRPVSGTSHAEAAVSGVIPYAGYHTVALNRAVPVGTGETFSAVIHLTDPQGGRVSLTYERPISNTLFNSAVSSERGESYYSQNGSAWYDFNSYTTVSETIPDGNLRIKAFTDDIPLKEIRLSGQDRYETMALIAEQAFPEGADEAIIVTGQDFPDALSAAPYAGAKDIPLLITSRAVLKEPVKKLLSDTWGRRVKKVTFIGGGFSDSVEISLQNDCGVEIIDDTTFSGKDRYHTAELVCEQGLLEGLFTTDACAVATGQKPADALAMSPWSYYERIPVLLARNGTVRESTDFLIRLFDRAYALGADAVVSESIFADKTMEVVRLAGNSRYATAVAIASFFVPESGADGPRPAHEAFMSQVTFAAGPDKNFPDALCGAMIAGRIFGRETTPGPILLVGLSAVDPAVTDYLKPYKPTHESPLDAYFLGAVPESVENAIIRQLESQYIS